MKPKSCFDLRTEVVPGPHHSREWGLPEVETSFPLAHIRFAAAFFAGLRFGDEPMTCSAIASHFG